MHLSTVENEILDCLQSLNGNQKSEVLQYLKRMPRKNHSTRLYRRKAFKQIRAALQDQ